MSDGPHRTLPMRRPWRDLAERAATPAYSPDEVNAALPLALRDEFREAPLAEVADILRGERQGSLFREERSHQLNALRASYPGSVVATTLIECALEAVADGLQGESALHIAVTNALKAHGRTGGRQIEEHYQRNRSHGNELRDRLLRARKHCRYDALASELLSEGQAGDVRPHRRSGIDEGPQL